VGNVVLALPVMVWTSHPVGCLCRLVDLPTGPRLLVQKDSQMEPPEGTETDLQLKPSAIASSSGEQRSNGVAVLDDEVADVLCVLVDAEHDAGLSLREVPPWRQSRGLA
jgi:hypothetical protein